MGPLIRNRLISCWTSLRKKCSYLEFFWSVLSLIRTDYREKPRIFQHFDWIRTDTLYRSVLSPNAGKYTPEKLEIRTLFMQCLCYDARKCRYSDTFRKNNEQESFIFRSVFDIANLKYYYFLDFWENFYKFQQFFFFFFTILLSYFYFLFS